jgi:predicted ArsR family transcriptional regulator
LRREPLTISDAAARLKLTASGVRAHVAALEREGLVRRAGVARGSNRPAAIYELAPGVDAIFCSAYVPFVANLLRVLGDALPARRLAAVMHRAGRRLGASYPRPAGPLRVRVDAASQFLDELGALTDVEATPGRLTIRGYDCPLAAAAQGSPEVCRAMESFVAELVQAPVRERCDRAGRPRCCFEITRVGGRSRTRRAAT